MEKVPPPYYCTSAGHHVLGEKYVFIAGSFLKKSVFKAGTTVLILVVYIDIAQHKYTYIIADMKYP